MHNCNCPPHLYSVALTRTGMARVPYWQKQTVFDFSRLPPCLCPPVASRPYAYARRLGILVRALNTNLHDILRIQETDSGPSAHLEVEAAIKVCRWMQLRFAIMIWGGGNQKLCNRIVFDTYNIPTQHVSHNSSPLSSLLSLLSSTHRSPTQHVSHNMRRG